MRGKHVGPGAAAWEGSSADENRQAKRTHRVRRRFAGDRLEPAVDVVREHRAAVHGRDATALQVDLIGLTSCTPWAGTDAPAGCEPPEVRLRVAVQTLDRQVATDLADEVEALYTNGPAGGGGVGTSVRDSVAIVSTLVPRDLVQPHVEVLE